MKAHPCHQCPDRENHARWAERWWRLRRETDGLQRKIDGRTNSVAKTFDRICELLVEMGYLGEGGTTITARGRPAAPALHGEGPARRRVPPRGPVEAARRAVARGGRLDAHPRAAPRGGRPRAAVAQRRRARGLRPDDRALERPRGRRGRPRAAAHRYAGRRARVGRAPVGERAASRGRAARHRPGGRRLRPAVQAGHRPARPADRRGRARAWRRSPAPPATRCCAASWPPTASTDGTDDEGTDDGDQAYDVTGWLTRRPRTSRCSDNRAALGRRVPAVRAEVGPLQGVAARSPERVKHIHAGEPMSSCDDTARSVPTIEDARQHGGRLDPARAGFRRPTVADVRDAVEDPEAHAHLRAPGVMEGGQPREQLIELLRVRLDGVHDAGLAQFEHLLHHVTLLGHPGHRARVGGRPRRVHLGPDRHHQHVGSSDGFRLMRSVERSQDPVKVSIHPRSTGS